jgi:hypothetical protein
MKALNDHDEFQSVVDLDPYLPSLMRAIFQHHAEAAHAFLGKPSTPDGPPVHRSERVDVSPGQASLARPAT